MLPVKLIKEVMYFILRYSGYLKLRDRYLYMKGKTWCTILLYHRVDENIENDPVDINISPDEFRKHIEVFSRNYHVISVADLIEYLQEGRSFPPKTICITFDDSYESIFRNAVPILKEHEVPACFFINDGYLDRDRTYPWDEIIEYRQPMMSSEQVRELADDGFEIGVHTTNHKDLGNCDYDTAHIEIAGSRKELERILGKDLGFFSIPFGRKSSFTSETISIVKESGFVCCFSAYGGYVDSDSDMFNLERLPYSDDYSSIVELRSDIDRVF